MSLTKQASEAQFWKDFSQLRELVGNCGLGLNWEGHTSISSTPFTHVVRALRLYALVESNEQKLIEVFRARSQKAGELRASGLLSEAEESHRLLDELRVEIHRLSEFQEHVSQRFHEQAEHLIRIARDA